MKATKGTSLKLAVQHAAAYAAYHAEHKPTPSKTDWNKLVQLIGISAGFQRVPYKYGIELKPVWTASYKAAQKGHIVGKSVAIPAPKPKASPKPAEKPTASVKATEAPSEPKAAVLAAIAALAIAIEAL